MFVAWDTLFNTGRIDHKLKEIIRVQLSRMASCTLLRQRPVRFGEAAGPDRRATSTRASSTTDERAVHRGREARAALQRADGDGPGAIDAAFYDELRRHYTEEEIVELGTFIGFNIGYHTFFGTLGFYPMFAPDGRLVSQEESARIYGDAPVSLAAGGRMPEPRP